MHRACERLQIHRGAGGCGAGHRASEGRVLFTVSIAASPRVASRKGPEGVIALKGVGVILHAVFFNRFASRSSYYLLVKTCVSCNDLLQRTFALPLCFEQQCCGK
jgi:hypothetical protein